MGSLVLTLNIADNAQDPDLVSFLMLAFIFLVWCLLLPMISVINGSVLRDFSLKLTETGNGEPLVSPEWELPLTEGRFS